MHPAGRVNGLGGLVRLLPVTQHHTRAARAELAGQAPNHSSTGERVDDLDLEVRHDPADGFGPALEVVVDPGHGRDRRGLGHAVGDGDLGHVHLRHDPLHHLDGTRRAGHDPGAQRGQVVRREVVESQLRDEHGGDAIQARATFLLDGFERGCRVKGRSGDHHAGAVARRRQVAHDHAEAVVEGHRQADPVLLRVAHELADEEAVVQDVVVAQRGALGEPRRARGVLDVDRVIGAQRRHTSGQGIQLIHSGGRPGCSQPVPAVLADVDHVVKVVTLGPHLVDHGPIVRRLVLDRADKHAHPRLSHDIGELMAAIGRVDIDQYRADLGRGELQQSPLRTVRRPDADPVAGVDPAGQQAQGQRRDVGVELGVRPAATTGDVDQRFGIGQTRDGSRQVVADRVTEQRRIGGS